MTFSFPEIDTNNIGKSIKAKNGIFKIKELDIFPEVKEGYPLPHFSLVATTECDKKIFLFDLYMGDKFLSGKVNFRAPVVNQLRLATNWTNDVKIIEKERKLKGKMVLKPCIAGLDISNLEFEIQESIEIDRGKKNYVTNLIAVYKDGVNSAGRQKPAKIETRITPEARAFMAQNSTDLPASGQSTTTDDNTYGW